MVTVFLHNTTVNANPFALTGFSILKQYARNGAAASAPHCQVKMSTRRKEKRKIKPEKSARLASEQWLHNCYN